MSTFPPDNHQPARAPLKAMVGLTLINELVKREAPRNEILGAICATAQETPHFAVNFFLDSMVKLGYLSDTEAVGCRQLYAEAHPERPPLPTDSTGEYPLQVLIGLERIEHLVKFESDPVQIAGAVVGTAQLMPGSQVGTFFDAMVKRGVIGEHTAQMCREIYLDKNPDCQSLALN
ncbi:hypothetical protein KQ940_11230 [Marinobacterium sp. D7]|uniref:hypothetical protein n=1 Tax=Marinobacterium ramblicola TaxID=2849041 RepID=UPI001C2D7709|nr:hypothetical protein [Marinobacterium ramblicola]MBV1788626.1 hypothetical protein [Marinobacterium ramblicola]